VGVGDVWISDFYIPQKRQERGELSVTDIFIYVGVLCFVVRVGDEREECE